jgi:hypothetical protein
MNQITTPFSDTQTTSANFQEVKNQIKAFNPDTFNLLILEPQLYNYDHYYLKYDAKSINRYPRRVTFPLKKKLESKLLEIKNASNPYHIIDKKEIKPFLSNSILNQYLDGIRQPSSISNLQSFLLLKKGFQEKKSFINSYNSNIYENSEIDTKINSSEVSSFLHAPLSTENARINDKQPIYYLPEYSEKIICETCKGEQYVNCPDCDGEHERTCKTCNGTGEIDCVGMTARNGREYTTIDLHCKNGRVNHPERGWITCEKCGGKGKIKCTSKNADRYVISAKKMIKSAINEYCNGTGKIICKTCYGDSQRYGKVECEICEARGEIGQIVYYETQIDKHSGELIYSSNGIVDIITKKPELILKHITSSVNCNEVYKNINKTPIESYDENSKNLCNSIEDELQISKHEYPMVVEENVGYSLIPCYMVNYTHILSGKKQSILIINQGNKNQEIVFLDNPEKVKINGLKAIETILQSKLNKAFSTHSHDQKMDAINEVKLIIEAAQSNGGICENIKELIAQKISDIKLITPSEIRDLTQRISSSKGLIDSDLIFSSSKKANEILESIQKSKFYYTDDYLVLFKRTRTINEKNEGQTFVDKIINFFTTWQISIPVILLLISILIGINLLK